MARVGATTTLSCSHSCRVPLCSFTIKPLSAAEVQVLRLEAYSFLSTVAPKNLC